MIFFQNNIKIGFLWIKEREFPQGCLIKRRTVKKWGLREVYIGTADIETKKYLKAATVLSRWSYSFGVTFSCIVWLSENEKDF